MTRRLLAVLVAGTAAGVAPVQPALPSSAARDAIMAAEDNRLRLPDGLHSPAIDVLRARQAEDLRLLLDLARSRDLPTQTRAIRALGRLERRDVVPDLLQYLTTGPTAETANALAQALRGEALASDRSGQQVQGVLEALVQVGELSTGASRGALGVIARSIGRLPYERAEQVRTADAFLLAAMRGVDPDPDGRGLLRDITRGIETLARVHTRLAPLGRDTIEWLRGIVINRRHGYPPAARAGAMAALVAATSVDAETLRGAATAAEAPDLRRLAALVLGGAAAPVVATERTELVAALLSDSSSVVRLEAVRAWARQETSTNGCQRILDALKDPSLQVALAATDALGDQCRDDVNVTDRLTAEARTPPANEWHRESHALVALAKRAPGRVFIPLLGAHVQHAAWQVRMYAARAAAITNDVSALERLAYDSNDNVREAALAPLRRLKGDEAEPYFLAALARADYQLLRTAANELKGAKPAGPIAAALADALARVTAGKKETSRDTRIALLERLRELGDPDQVGAIVPLLQDFDVAVAQAAAGLLEQWTGKPQEIAPQLLPRPPLPLAGELDEAAETPGRIKLANGKIIRVTLLPEVAPLASVRFLRLAKAGYYNGLTIHRVVPNFVVQGGSPGANEYSGDGPYMRDEVGLTAHTPGTMGLSTRGRDTGDAQIFVNLVDNPRLDFEYTVFAYTDLTDPDIVPEGETIESVTFEKPAEGKNQATAGSSMRIVPASASASTAMPCASVHCGIACPIIAPDHAGIFSGAIWSAKISSSVSAPKLLSPGVHSEQVPKMNPAILERIPASFNCVSMRSMR